jgi:cytochrome P450 family 26 subfamily A
VAAKAFTFGGYTVPKGSRVVHLQTLCHFLPEHYDDPTAFKPQRFLDDPDLPAKHVHGLFGGGGHGCVGVPLVRMLTPLFVANMIKRYDIDFAPDMTLDAHFRTMVTPATPKVMATIRPRCQALGPA